MRHVLPGQDVHPRQPAMLARRQLGQLTVIVAGQTGASLADLLLDQVEVVRQPLGGGSDGFAGANRRKHIVARGAQRLVVVVEPPQQPSAAAAARHVVPGGELAAALFEQLGSQELAADRRLDWQYAVASRSHRARSRATGSGPVARWTEKSSSQPCKECTGSESSSKLSLSTEEIRDGARSSAFSFRPDGGRRRRRAAALSRRERGGSGAGVARWRGGLASGARRVR